MTHKKFGPDRFSRFDVYWFQTNKQTDRQAKFIYRFDSKEFRKSELVATGSFPLRYCELISIIVHMTVYIKNYCYNSVFYFNQCFINHSFNRIYHEFDQKNSNFRNKYFKYANLFAGRSIWWKILIILLNKIFRFAIDYLIQKS